MSKRILVEEDTFVALFAPRARFVIRDNKDNSAISVSRRSSNIFSQSFCSGEMVWWNWNRGCNTPISRDWGRLSARGEGLKGRKEEQGVIEYSNFESGSLKFLPREGESCYSVDVIREADNVIIKFLLPMRYLCIGSF